MGKYANSAWEGIRVSTMGRKTKAIVGFVASCVTTAWLIAGAHAAVVQVGDLGTLAPGSSGLFGHFTTSANSVQLTGAGNGQVIIFEVNAPSSISTLSATINILNLIGIEGFNVAVVKQVGVNVFDVISGPSSGPGNVVSLSFAGLSAGTTYGLLFTGTSVKPFGGFYLGGYSVAAVPLPPAVWLFLSALIGLVGVVRSRRKRPVETGSGHEVAAAA